MDVFYAETCAQVKLESGVLVWKISAVLCVSLRRLRLSCRLRRERLSYAEDAELQ